MWTEFVDFCEKKNSINPINIFNGKIKIIIIIIIKQWFFSSEKS